MHGLSSDERGHGSGMSAALAVVLGLLLIASLSPPAFSDPPTLETLSEQGWLSAAAGAYMSALLDDDPQALEDFVVRYRDARSLARTPVEARVARQRQIRAMLGSFELVAIEKHTDTELQLLVRSPSLGGYFSFSFVASEEEARKIATMGVRPAVAPVEGEESELVPTSLAEHVQSLYRRHAIPGIAVAVERGEGTPEIYVAGRRTVEMEDAVQTGDRFHVGSITKSMTASLLGRLVDQERLRFDQTLGELLPDLAMNDAYRDVTLAMLLRHRAGLEALLEPEPDRERAWREISDEPRLQRRALALDVLGVEPELPPGTTMSYSNAGYVVAAVVAEEITDEAWETLIHREVFEPLGLRSAGLGWPTTESRRNQPRGHWKVESGAKIQEEGGYEVGAALAPAGDVHCSVGDLATYGAAHLKALRGESTWLSKETAVELHRAGGLDSQIGYAMGWSLEPSPAGPLHVHAGSAGTFYALLALDPARDLVFAAAANLGDLALDALMRELLASVREE